MRRMLFIILGIIVVMAAGYFGYTAYLDSRAQADGSPAETAAGEAAPSVQQELDDIIWASGKLVPAQWAYLGFESGGRLLSLPVDEGDVVNGGQLLGRLDSAELDAAVAQAQAALDAAVAQQTAVAAPARPEQIAEADAAVQAAQAQLEAARSAVQTAETNVASAEAEVGIAQAEYNRVRAGARDEEIAAAREQLDRARAVRDQAQAAYDRVAGEPDIGMRSESVALQQATASYNAALASYNAIAKGARPQELAVAQSQIDAARAGVRTAQSGVTDAQAQIAVAEAAVAQAQANLELLRAGARAEDLAVAQASVDQSRAALAAAEAALARAELHAPFAGTVTAVWGRVGEVVAPAQQIFGLGNLDTMRVETTDLRETDVARVDLGQQVEITFDALPNQSFDGTIVRIAPMSILEKGSVNYTAIIELDELHPALRWGMTAFVNIEAD